MWGGFWGAGGCLKEQVEGFDFYAEGGGRYRRPGVCLGGGGGLIYVDCTYISNGGSVTAVSWSPWRGGGIRITRS